MDNKIVLIILAIFLPPVAVFLKKGAGLPLVINIALLLLTFGLGAIIHAFLVVFDVLK